MRAYERFLKYAAFPTMSSEETGTHPSTAKQLVLARELEDELIKLGLVDVEVDEWGYVYAELPANTDTVCNNIGFIAHMDTSSEASDENIKTKLVSYKGGDILLNEEKDIWLKVSDYPYVEEHKGQTLIVSDGTTLIGADDKAGIAEIMTALETLIENNIPHGKISVAFTPDEEIGEAVKRYSVYARVQPEHKVRIVTALITHIPLTAGDSASLNMRTSTPRPARSRSRACLYIPDRRRIG